MTACTFWRRCVVGVVALAAGASEAGPLRAQQGAGTAGVYQPPVLVLAQPPAGTALPQDRPIVVLRFGQGEPNDPIDVGSFAIAVDGDDRTRHFQVTATEAWGPLARDADASLIETGAHQLAARICSARGACTELSATVSVVPATLGAVSDEPKHSRRRKVLVVLLDAVKKILTP